ncbi:hypothetical protein Cgig2_024796 [Carnegiea gigantea]|uniref:Uncharacterized protein n=1 Tax=Carnegiea gigantea TaxID=171969 RepID=A0A9Q1K3M2_9CARY|nr:hypothetical protein Cgig2_024796 [Carnegiea gigantea]
MNVKVNGKSIWIYFNFNKIPIFYYGDRKMGHVLRVCKEVDPNTRDAPIWFVVALESRERNAEASIHEQQRLYEAFKKGKKSYKSSVQLSLVMEVSPASCSILRMCGLIAWNVRMSWLACVGLCKDHDSAIPDVIPQEWLDSLARGLDLDPDPGRQLGPCTRAKCSPPRWIPTVIVSLSEFRPKLELCGLKLIPPFVGNQSLKFRRLLASGGKDSGQSLNLESLQPGPRIWNQSRPSFTIPGLDPPGMN